MGRLVLVSDREDVIAGLRLRLPDEERPVLALLQQLLCGLAGQVAVEPPLRRRIGAVQRMPELDHFSVLLSELKSVGCNLEDLRAERTFRNDIELKS